MRATKSRCCSSNRGKWEIEKEKDRLCTGEMLCAYRFPVVPGEGNDAKKKMVENAKKAE